ncbi:FabD/lysophospholipase-like protein [Dothidotthia symphoricarpi CBS 119687]|uniref:FabD/lysophospholipase-like protein n=1 Tax=Dothidotthia symphoricarpi CBS 119687 TaxID=1392245 RepID=A0A6A6AC29_9PLEO|nr:FabD/lysophospholipase-like protein [Dothidotthia symphoricarpi CBS 119687]KAF2128417.1 FabD/lysophospholipase-like protein [Dothidotthia symphoricarpi CBS 119687]
MSCAQVDLSQVRYSPIEGTYYFYDHRYPSAIQFLLSGRWESWDVGWVKDKAHDPEIRRIAEEAETRLLHDARAYYRQWPAEVAGPSQPSPPPETDHQLRTPPRQSIARSQSSPRTDVPSPSPVPSHGSALQFPIPASPHEHVPSTSATRTASYSSPYRPQAAPVSDHRPQIVTTVPVQVVPTGIVGPSVHAGYQQYAHNQLGPPLQAATSPGLVTSQHRETKILLSMDGDGIRGLSTLLVVESLVNAICVKIGHQVNPCQIFDLMGGSSLGGVIAIMLGRLQMQAHRAREGYKRIARQVFLNKRDFFISLDPYAAISNVDAMALEREIKAVVKQEIGHEDELLFDGRDNLGDVFVATTHIEIGTNKAALMRSYQTRRITGPDIDANMTIWQALKATSVAPRYMLPQPGANQRLVIAPGLVDHGTAKNNPVRDILYECRKLYRYANDMMIIVSIGTGVGLNRDSEIAEMANSVEDRNAEARGWGEKFEVDHQALMERGWMKYFRFNVTGLEDVPLEEWCHEDIIKEKTSAYLAQPEVGHMFYACVDAITALILGHQTRQ